MDVGADASSRSLSPDFDPFDDVYLTDPYPFLARGREAAPVFYAEGLDHWVVTRYHDIRYILRTPAMFSATNGVNVVGVPNGQAAFRVGSAREISQWEQKRLRFRAKDPTTTIIFDAFGSSPPNGNGGDYLGLDNVELRKLCFIFDIGCRF